jgi:chorismate mutase
MPELSIICDPSHICGSRELLGEVAQKAIDLNMDGLMLETHRDPSNAWSDADQQVTPKELDNILANLVWRNPNSLDLEVKAKLEELRAAIDGLDRDILELLMNRLEVTRKIGEYKKEHNITILQHQRWNEILHDREAFIKGKDISLRFLYKFLEAIHEESIQQQTAVMNASKAEDV